MMQQLVEQSAAAMAWASVLDAIRKHGAYYSVRFEDPAISAAIVRMGGWIRLCGKSSQDLHNAASREFRALYGSGLGEANIVTLRGIIDRDNPAGCLDVVRVS